MAWWKPKSLLPTEANITIWNIGSSTPHTDGRSASMLDSNELGENFISINRYANKVVSSESDNLGNVFMSILSCSSPTRRFALQLFLLPNMHTVFIDWPNDTNNGSSMVKVQISKSHGKNFRFWKGGWSSWDPRSSIISSTISFVMK